MYIIDCNQYILHKSLNCTLQEALRYYNGVFWFDSSIRFTSNNLSSVFEHAVNTHGALMFHTAHSSVYTVTHPKMYTYLPTDTEQLKSTTMRGSGAFLLYNTNVTYHDVLLPMYACALEKDCIAPTDQVACDPFLVQQTHDYAGCHRYGQSILAITILNKCNFDVNCYGHDSYFYVIKRKATHMYRIQTKKLDEVKTAGQFRVMIKKYMNSGHKHR